MQKVQRLHSEFGQSIWMDYLDRNLIESGALQSLVDQGLRGITSNPTIFDQALAQSGDYDAALHDLIQAGQGVAIEVLYEWLVIQDIQRAADILAPVYADSDGNDGFVSLEVSPRIAYQADATVKAAEHLWRAVNRPNLMIKVPATEPGLLAIEHLIGRGINVNVTLLFSIERYRAVTEAYRRGLALNSDPRQVASVASFFLSRIDTKLDQALTGIGTETALALRGRAAIASAKLAYQHFTQFAESTPFAEQRQRGARPQRLLWASTRTKNPDYSDVLYVEQLVGPQTVNTLTPATLDAFQAHGEPRLSLNQGLEQAQQEVTALAELGFDLSRIAAELEAEGVQKFVDAYEQSLSTLADKRHELAKHFAGP